ncbi:hypothetical protein [Microbacterium pumilum]|uniref:Uncharacterized protein n=1 Tax=Microbacterium pumilum TaxID=344165 RepID=A0ABN2RTY7_9MICO
MKVMIVVLVAIVVAVVLVLFYGSLRPEGESDQAQGGVGGGLGWLVPRPSLDFADVADADCADATIPGFVVGAAGCAIPLPDPAQITLCAPDPATVIVRTEGKEYPAQTVKASALSCSDPQPVPIYDDDTTMTIQCVLIATCTVVVVEPEG